MVTNVFLDLDLWGFQPPGKVTFGEPASKQILEIMRYVRLLRLFNDVWSPWQIYVEEARKRARSDSETNA